MQYEFLKNFPRRMKTAGLSAVLIQNIVQKTSWNKYSYESADEKINLVFSVLLFVMDQSLKEEPCILDDVAAYIDSINSRYIKKPLTYEECRGLADFIMNDILSNGGVQMNFQAYDFELEEVISIPIRYVINEVTFLNNEVRRTSFKLTDDGYNLVLGTMEMENNMRLTVQEIVFRMHLERQHFDKAVDSIKDVFAGMRKQLQSIQEAMRRIRRNALEYSVAEYESLMNENLETIANTKSRFEEYRNMVAERVSELEERRVELDKLSKEDMDKLENLKVINDYLGRTLDEHQRILTTHYDLKELYGRELEDITQALLIKRFPIRNGIYDVIMRKPWLLADFDRIINPLFNRNPEKIYDPLRAAAPQMSLKIAEEADVARELDFDPEEFEREKERLRKEKLLLYEACLGYIIKAALRSGSVRLSELKEMSVGKERHVLIPDINIFKEVMIELIKLESIDIEELRKERKSVIANHEKLFELSLMLLDILEGSSKARDVKHIEIIKHPDKTVVFEGIEDEFGRFRNISCSDVEIICVMER